MSQQIKFITPNNDWAAIDNSAPPTFPTFNAGTNLGYDTTAPGATSQSTNPFADTGSVLLDSVNDTVPKTSNISTVVGNPVSNISPTGKVLTTVMNSPLTTRLLHKNPA